MGLIASPNLVIKELGNLQVNLRRGYHAPAMCFSLVIDDHYRAAIPVGLHGVVL